MIRGLGLTDEFTLKARSIIDVDAIEAQLSPVLEEYRTTSPACSTFSPEEFVEYVLFQTALMPADKGVTVQYVPGARLDGGLGPSKRVEIMIVGPIARGVHAFVSGSDKPEERIETNRLLGPTAPIIVQALNEAGYTDWANIYVTNLVRFFQPQGRKTKQIPKRWINLCQHFLQQEYLICQPKVVIAMGAEPTKIFTNGYTITQSENHIFNYQLGHHKSNVVCVIDPIRVVEKPEFGSIFSLGVGQAVGCISGSSYGKGLGEEDHYYIEDEAALAMLVDCLLEEGVKEFAVDCEWGGVDGSHWYDRGARLRTIQFSWAPDKAAVVILRRQGLVPAFKPYESSAIDHLRRLFCRPGVSLFGHNISADYPWLKEYGLELASYFMFDTMLASHLLDPVGHHGLEALTVRYLKDWPRYDFVLEQWLRDNKKKSEVKANGYSCIPDHMLHLYGARDTRATFQLKTVLNDLLLLPENESLYRLFYDLVMPGNQAIMDMEYRGCYVDRPRLIELEEIYRTQCETMIETFRTQIGDPTFNPDSTPDKVKFLYNRLRLTPVKTTGKPAIMWEEVEAKGLTGSVSPSADNESLGMLAESSGIELVEDLRDISVLRTVQKAMLVGPTKTIFGDDDYQKGLIGSIAPDGRIHTSFSQMLKSGRLGAREPNLLSLPNKQATAASRILGKVPSIRSCFVAPEGRLLIASDYKQAELAAIAYMSGDHALIEAIERGEDIHGAVAKQMFQLTCPVNEVSKRHKDLRVAAKSIVFGLLYGRGPKAIAREVRKAGLACTTDDARDFMDQFMSSFTGVRDLIERVHRQIDEKMYVENLWGRREYFYRLEGMDLEGARAAQKRQGFNFGIQSYVADLLRQALINFMTVKRSEPDLEFDLVLTYHDAVILETAIHCAERMVKEVVPWCMTHNSKAPKLGFVINVDVELSKRWGEDLIYEDLLDLGFAPPFVEEVCARDKEKNIIHR